MPGTTYCMPFDGKFVTLFGVLGIFWWIDTFSFQIFSSGHLFATHNVGGDDQVTHLWWVISWASTKHLGSSRVHQDFINTMCCLHPRSVGQRKMETPELQTWNMENNWISSPNAPMEAHKFGWRILSETSKPMPRTCHGPANEGTASRDRTDTCCQSPGRQTSGTLAKNVTTKITTVQCMQHVWQCFPKVWHQWISTLHFTQLVRTFGGKHFISLIFWCGPHSWNHSLAALHLEMRFETFRWNMNGKTCRDLFGTRQETPMQLVYENALYTFFQVPPRTLNLFEPVSFKNVVAQ